MNKDTLTGILIVSAVIGVAVAIAVGILYFVQIKVDRDAQACYKAGGEVMLIKAQVICVKPGILIPYQR